LAVHNIPTAADRLRALDEAVRVLRPGGRLLLAD
jgi:arsenite methyltransferase